MDAKKTREAALAGAREGLRRGARRACSPSFATRARRGRARSRRSLDRLNRTLADLDPEDLPRGPAGEVREGLLRRGALQVRGRPRQHAEIRCRRPGRSSTRIRAELDAANLRLATLQAGGVRGQRARSSSITARQDEARRLDREALGRLQAAAAEVRQPEAGRALPAAQLADPRHDQPVAAGPAGAAARALQRRQLHEDPPRGPLRDLPRRGGPEGIRRRRRTRSSGRTRT